ncbi:MULTISPECIES: VirB8 family type IV secretion system protein [Rickettsieae]|uniref:virB8 family protein n=1 Tax=Rickettsieae TaxID=33988 RepID=UPI000B9B14ED|nr:VirB8/TrbF family protein [Rickettsia endosymbiont of Culicoides newsteadi]OZG32462.1 virB8 family protein [Rickettsia endosymbiont of Culicoides newsteadi]
MFKLANILNTLKSPTNPTIEPKNVQSGNSVKITRNWYEERSDKIIVQRNILLVISILLILLVMASIAAVTIVINSREFSPFVIQIDNSTGMATIVNPISSEILSGNDALSRYFIKKYLIARETYNPVDFDTEARRRVRLLSSNSVYYNYLGYIKNKDIDPVLMYGQNNTTFLLIKSWSKLQENLQENKNKYMIRFSINETAGDRKVFNKIAVVSFSYIPMELTDIDRDINPVGFQINDYRVDDDNS